MECSLRAEDYTNSIKDQMNVKLSSPLWFCRDFTHDEEWVSQGLERGAVVTEGFGSDPHPPALNGAILGGSLVKYHK